MPKTQSLPPSRKLAEYAVFRGASQKIAELSPLIRLLRRRKLRCVVEIGTMRGGTFWLWCQLAQSDARVASIDLPGGEFGGGYRPKDVKRFRTYGRRKQELHFFRKDSQQESTRDLLIERIDHMPIDFLFIDGDHRLRGVKRDYELYAPLVRRGGLIAFHDILRHPKVPECQVHKFWRQVRQGNRVKEYIDKDDDRGWGVWGGIGLLYKA